MARIGGSPCIAAVNSSMCPASCPRASRVLCRIRRDRDLREAADDAVGHEGGRREAVRAAAGATRDDEAIDPERLRDGFHVTYGISDRAALVARGLAITRTVVGDPPQAVAGVDGGISQ